ncbi:MAG: hypothetical protein JO121_04525 [Deltaproteobacteria bacterium]|nr:hypothetical protein [Deltaproteobacteria bacterium]
MFSFYMKKSYADWSPGIELVNIHYTWTPLAQMPNWEAHRETRAMPRGGTLLRGMGGTTLDEQGQSVHTQTEVIHLPDDGVRRKILKLPNEILDGATGKYTDNYLFHHYFEVFRNGKRENSQLYTEEIVSKEVEYIDHNGNLGGMCIYWSIGDWDSPQYQPTEEQNFTVRYGEDSPYRSFKFYGCDNREEFSRNRSEMLKALPMPRRFVGRIRGPKGSEVHQRWHVGGMWTPIHADRWEDYWEYVVHNL